MIKNHPLADGNKRCGSFLFLWYLRRNQALLAKPVEQLINDNTLVALALLLPQLAIVHSRLLSGMPTLGPAQLVASRRNPCTA
ncbi:MAG: hypothetical protein RJQ10_10860 [Haliea sp.]|uniref:hypothetical protein n=1 Tax=Haliea sp. TaxID=1932666 RepID=UPI0032ECD8E3